MASAALKHVLEQVLDALPDTATLQDLLLALQLRADMDESLEAAEANAPDLDSDGARLELGLPASTCGARRRKAAGP